MATRREQILAAAVTALGGASKPTGFIAERSRVRELDVEDIASGWGGVYPIRETVEYESVLPQVHRRLRWKVSLRVTGSAIYDQVIDPLHLWTTESLLADDTFGGLAVATVEVGTEWVGEEMNDYIPGCDIEFETLYVTDQADQESFG